MTLVKKNLDQKIWTVYIAKCADQSYYVGISTDVVARVAKHNAGTGAKYTRSRKPVVLVYSEQLQNRSDASKREWQLKQLTHKEKIALAEQGEEK